MALRPRRRSRLTLSANGAKLAAMRAYPVTSALLALLLAACEDTRARGPQRETGSGGALEADGGATGDVVTGAGGMGAHGTVVVKADGTAVTGELIHVYDLSENLIPNGSRCTDHLYALFDPARYDADPQEDASITFICSTDVTDIHTYPPDPTSRRSPSS